MGGTTARRTTARRVSTVAGITDELDGVGGSIRHGLEATPGELVGCLGEEGVVARIRPILTLRTAQLGRGTELVP
ncbi:MAG: hypothetical protein GY719_29025 [bacterium]|nr:hypothetical protein [bacterium]